MKKSTKKRITLRTVYDSIQDISKKIDTKITDKIDDLARMVATNLNDHTEQLSRIDIRLANLEFGQQDINSKLDSMAYSFDVVDLRRRVEVLERKAKVSK